MNSREDESKEGNLDPVCGMTVTEENAACSYDHKGKIYYFCAASCKDEFVASPYKYLRQ